MSSNFEQRIAQMQKDGFAYTTEESSSEEGQISEDESTSESNTSATSTAKSQNGDEQEFSFSDRSFDEDDREFEVGQVLEDFKLPSTASAADKKRRADWARNLSYTVEKIDKYSQTVKTLKKESHKKRRKLSKILKQLGKLNVRSHYPGNTLRLD